MLNPNIEIKKWFYTNLTSASGLTVYDGIAPEGASDEYIVMTGRTSTQEQGKSGYTNGVSIDVDIVTKNANFGYKRAETISSLSVASIRNLDGLNPTENVFRTIITYNIIITQN